MALPHCKVPGKNAQRGADKVTTAPKTLTVTECHQVLAEILVEQGTKKQYAKGLRNYTMALLMLDAGLRVGEVVQLRQTDLIFSTEPVISLIVPAQIAKTKEERTVPLSARVRIALKQMYGCWWRRDIQGNTNYAFYWKESSEPITTRQVERIIFSASMKSIGRPIHPHVLRHTFADRIRKVADLPTLQQLLGHKNLASTQVYMHPGADDRMKAIKDLEGPAAVTHPEIHTLPCGTNAANRIDTTRTDQDH